MIKRSRKRRLSARVKGGLVLRFKSSCNWVVGVIPFLIGLRE